MLCNSDKLELSNFTWLFIMFLVIGNILILINPAFNVFSMKVFLICEVILITIFIFGKYYFTTSTKLGLRYLTWQALIASSALLLTLMGYVQLWLSATGDITGAVFIFIVLIISCLIAFFIRVFEPKSNFEAGIKSGRFSLFTFNFESSAMLSKEVSPDNIVLTKLGLSVNKASSSFESTIRKGGMYAAIFIALGGLMKLYNLTEVFYLLVMSGWLASMGYIFSNCYIGDLYCCIKAGYLKNHQ